MLASNPDFLHAYGWNGFFESQLATLVPTSLEDHFAVARVIGEEKSLYRLQLGFDQVQSATLAGKYRYRAGSRMDFPAVGDWVICEPTAGNAVVHATLGRKSVVARKEVLGNDAQILAANVDYFLIATSLNDDLNFRRVERYLAISWDSGAIPILLLTKADLAEDAHAIEQETQRAFPGVAVHLLTVKDPKSIEVLRDYLKTGQTAVIVGSSGVGKSTLTNLLIGQEKLATNEIREEDGRGRHTTTSRFLLESTFGGLIIDTPGMREISLLDHEEGVQKQFEDIEALVRLCRFTDCGHANEPGCSVREALSAGELDSGRWQSYVKLQKELRFEARKRDKAAASEEKQKWKKIHKDVAQKMRFKKRQLFGDGD